MTIWLKIADRDHLTVTDDREPDHVAREVPRPVWNVPGRRVRDARALERAAGRPLKNHSKPNV